MRNWLRMIGQVATRRGGNRTGVELSEEDEQASTEPRPRARILHLSDLHLGPVADAQYLDHPRVPISGDRLAQRDIVKATLESLASSGELKKVEAVVISGDLSNRGKPEGFQFFGGLAEILLGELKPECIVVVPGNHDVDKDHEPGDPARYAGFLATTRERGFATPLLDGIDFGADGRLKENAMDNPHLVRGNGFVILPLNSSHFCWVQEQVSSSLLDGLPSVPEEIVDQATKELRTHDMPRVSNPQMLAVRHYLEACESIPSTSLRFATLHHQLLPVDAREEMKRFEGLTNLGAVREFLADLGVEVALHGHKHAAALYWDQIAVSSHLDVPPHNVLVSAAPANFEPGEPVGRVLTLGASSLAPEVTVEEIRAGSPYGSEPELHHFAVARIWEMAQRGSEGAELIAAEDFNTVYARVQSRFETVPEEAALRYLVCEISRPGRLDRPPAGYPEPHPGWFDDLVEWWQFPEPHFDSEVTFNHGERIRRRWGDQAAAAARLLSAAIPNEVTTTRASILLVDPQREASPEGDGEFPSFVSIQLQLVERRGAYELDCTGYFRKQEMRYWWPINVAELGRVQHEVVGLIKPRERLLRKGTIRTIAAYAIAKGTIPAVAHAAVDRAVDREPAELWRLAYGLMQPTQVSDRPALRARWEHYLEDLRPRDAKTLPARSRRGLQAVLSFTEVDSLTSGATPVIEALGDLVEFYATSNFDPPDPHPVVAALQARLEALEQALDREYGVVAGV